MDKKVENIKALQAELDRRTAVEKLAEKMIIDGKFEEAKELLDTLDDDRARELMEEEKNIELLKRYKWRLRKACWVKLTSFFYRKILLIEDIQIQWRCENGEFP